MKTLLVILAIILLMCFVACMFMYANSTKVDTHEAEELYVQLYGGDDKSIKTLMKEKTNAVKAWFKSVESYKPVAEKITNRMKESNNEFERLFADISKHAFKVVKLSTQVIVEQKYVTTIPRIMLAAVNVPADLFKNRKKLSTEFIVNKAITFVEILKFIRTTLTKEHDIEVIDAEIKYGQAITEILRVGSKCKSMNEVVTEVKKPAVMNKINVLDMDDDELYECIETSYCVMQLVNVIKNKMSMKDVTPILTAVASSDGTLPDITNRIIKHFS